MAFHVPAPWPAIFTVPEEDSAYFVASPVLVGEAVGEAVGAAEVGACVGEVDGVGSALLQPARPMPITAIVAAIPDRRFTFTRAPKVAVRYERQATRFVDGIGPNRMCWLG